MFLRKLFLTLAVLLAATVLHAESRTDLAKRWLVYGQGLAAQGRLDDAVAAYGKSLALAPDLAAAYHARGNAQWKAGRKDAALADFRQALQLDPAQPGLAAWLAAQGGASAGGADAQEQGEDRLSEAQSVLEQRDLAGALKLFDQGAKDFPRDAAWRRGQAEASYGLGRFDQARAALDQGLKLAPQDSELLRLKNDYFHADLQADQGGGSVWSPLWRSTLFPGWGQAHNGQRKKAWTVGLVTWTLLAATVVTYVEADQAQADYRGLDANLPQSSYDDAFGKADTWAIANEAVGACFYAAYAYNIFDAATHGPAPAQAAWPRGPRLTVLAVNF